MGIKRRRREVEEIEAALEHRRWDELLPDALGQIFSKISITERVTVIPIVCKSWAKAVTQPNCWQDIDLLQWTYRPLFHLRHPADQSERIVQMLVARSSGSVRKLGVYGLQSHSVFTCIAQNARCLRTLIIPESKISDSIVKQIAGRLSSVTFLDVSYCMHITGRGLKLIGKNCKLLEGLGRQMHMWDTADKPPFDNEALAIALTMRNLKHLEICGHSMTTEGVREILGSCSKLEHLRLSGCENVEAANLGLTRDKFPKLTVWGPHSSNHFDGEGHDPWESMERECKEMRQLSAGFVLEEASDYFYLKAHAYVAPIVCNAIC